MLIVFLRVLILYGLVLLVLRIMGKKQVATLQPYELVTIILMADVAAIPMAATGTPLVNGIVGVFALLLAQFTLSYLTMISPRSRAWLSGRPTVMIADGKIVESSLRELRYSVDDLIEQMRAAGYPLIHDVEFAILETNGQLTVIPKSQKRPVTPADMGIPTAYEGLPTPLIVDGRLDRRNLANVNLDEQWLLDQLKQRGLSSPRQVLYASLDTKGNLFCQPKESAQPRGNGGR